MPRVIHFEIPADNPERAIKFYQSTFGWKFDKFPGPQDYWLVKTGEGVGIDGGLMPRMPEMVTTNTVDVSNLDQAIASVEKNGGKLVVPRMTIRTVGYLAYCTDTEGNVFGMIQMDPAAA